MNWSLTNSNSSGKYGKEKEGAGESLIFEEFKFCYIHVLSNYFSTPTYIYDIKRL